MSALIERVIARARNLSSPFPYDRDGEALYLGPDEWATLADFLIAALSSEDATRPTGDKE